MDKETLERIMAACNHSLDTGTSVHYTVVELVIKLVQETLAADAVKPEPETK